MTYSKKRRHSIASILCAISLTACQTGLGPANYACIQADGSAINDPNCYLNQTGVPTAIPTGSAQPSSSPTPSTGVSSSPSGSPAPVSNSGTITLSDGTQVPEGQPASVTVEIQIPSNGFTAKQSFNPIFDTDNPGSYAQIFIKGASDTAQEARQLLDNVNNTYRANFQEVKSGVTQVAVSVVNEGEELFQQTAALIIRPGENTVKVNVEKGEITSSGNPSGSAIVSVNSTFSPTSGVDSLQAGSRPMNSRHWCLQPGKIAFANQSAEQNNPIFQKFYAVLATHGDALGEPDQTANLNPGNFCVIQRTLNNDGYKMEFFGNPRLNTGRGVILLRDGGKQAFPVHSGIYAKYSAAGGTKTLGYPTTYEIPGRSIKGKPSVYQRFDGDPGGDLSIHWTADYGGKIFKSGIRTTWNQYYNLLGHPTGDEYTTSFGAAQSFEKGEVQSTREGSLVILDQDPKNSPVVADRTAILKNGMQLSGQFWEYYKSHSTELGLPISGVNEEVSSASLEPGWSQYFVNGALFMHRGGEYSGQIFFVPNKYLGALSNIAYDMDLSLGFPISNEVSAGSTGTQIEFEEGFLGLSRMVDGQVENYGGDLLTVTLHGDSQPFYATKAVSQPINTNQAINVEPPNRLYRFTFPPAIKPEGVLTTTEEEQLARDLGPVLVVGAIFYEVSGAADVATIIDPNAGVLEKTLAVASIGLNFTPIGVVGKLAAEGTLTVAEVAFTTQSEGFQVHGAGKSVKALAGVVRTAARDSRRQFFKIISIGKAGRLFQNAFKSGTNTLENGIVWSARVLDKRTIGRIISKNTRPDTYVKGKLLAELKREKALFDSVQIRAQIEVVKDLRKTAVDKDLKYAIIVSDYNKEEIVKDSLKTALDSVGGTIYKVSDTDPNKILKIANAGTRWRYQEVNNMKITDLLK